MEIKLHIEPEHLEGFAKMLAAELAGHLAEQLDVSKSNGKPSPNHNESRLLDISEVAERANVSEKTIFNHTWSPKNPTGSLPCVRIGNRVLYDPADVGRWINERKPKANGCDDETSKKVLDPPNPEG